MTIMNSFPRTLIQRHSSLAHQSSNGLKCRFNHRLIPSAAASTSAAPPSAAYSSFTAGNQLITTTTQSPPHRPGIINATILQSPAYQSHIPSTYRSMVTVTQTSASSETDNDNTAPIIHHSTSSSSAPSDTTTNNNGGELLTITPSCAARIRQLASSRPNPDKVYLRLYVDAGGCSGFQYKFLLLSEDNNDEQLHEEEEEEDGTIDPEEDIVFVKDGMRLVVDQTSLDLLRGSTIDYVQEMIRSSFAVVGNPQSESACGCGSSFAVKNFESNPALD